MNPNGVGMDVELNTLAQKQASVCSVFANAKRVMILWTLADYEKSVGEIALAIEASMQSTSQHLNLMKKMGILDARRDGQTIYYYIVNNGVMDRCQLLLQVNQNNR